MVRETIEQGRERLGVTEGFMMPFFSKDGSLFLRAAAGSDRRSGRSAKRLALGELPSLEVSFGRPFEHGLRGLSMASAAP